MIGFSAIWKYRYFVLTSVRADFRNRVARSKLGLIWLILAPLAQVVIYAFVLSAVMSQKLPGIESAYSYPLYLLAGFQGWFLFVEILNRSLTVFIENANVLKKIAFPRITLPIVILISSIINNLIFLLIVLIAFMVLGFEVGPSIFWLPLVMLVNIMFAAGLGITAGIFNVFIRDVGQLFAIGIQFLFWMTPIVYTINIIPEHYHIVLQANPLFWIIENYHNVLVYNKAPDFVSLGLIGFLAVLLLALAFTLFRKSNAEMVDVL